MLKLIPDLSDNYHIRQTQPDCIKICIKNKSKQNIFKKHINYVVITYSYRLIDIVNCNAFKYTCKVAGQTM